MMKEKNKSLLWGALIGGVLGSVTALLLAPKSGRELRQDIADGVRTVGEQGANVIGKVKETAGNVFADIKEWRRSSDQDELSEMAQISSFTEDEEFEEVIQR